MKIPMKNFLHRLLLCFLSLLASSGCDVHEFPTERPVLVPFVLHLDFDTEMPLHKEVSYTRVALPEVPHDIRYTINAYRTDVRRGVSRSADTTFVFTSSISADPDYTAYLELPEGSYDFKVWADYVDSGSTLDKYYDTHDFSRILLTDRSTHAGSTDYRDAFRGYASATVIDPVRYSGPALHSIENHATASMERPMGKYKFVSTDVELFAQMMKERGKLMGSVPESDTKTAYEQLLQSIDMGEFHVVFRYHPFMPCEYNMFTDKPGDSWDGVSFVSRMHIDEGREMSLGYDYIFVNGTETTLGISVEVYDRSGELMSSTNPVSVPIVRSRLTVVRGAFLTSKATGGVTISPGYEGDDYNREIY